MSESEYTKKQWDIQMAHEEMLDRREREEEAEIQTATNARWLIWSMEHGAWWAPNSAGYVRQWNRAGRYSFLAALEIVNQANILTGENPKEAMVMEHCAHNIESNIHPTIQKITEKAIGAKAWANLHLKTT